MSGSHNANHSTPENQLAFHQLYDSAIISLQDYNCRACRGGPAAEESTPTNNIVLMRQGAFCKHFGQRSVAADVNQAVFFSKGITYRVSHPADCGDRGTVFIPSPQILNDLRREIDPSIDNYPERPFPFVTGPCDSVIYWRYHVLLHHLETATPDLLEPLRIDAIVLEIVYAVLKAAYLNHGLPRINQGKRNDPDMTDRIEVVKNYLASRMNECCTLDDIARSVHISPFHLVRSFRQRTGMSIHRYITRLRLRNSLERLADGVKDLTTLALDLGFSSHSHFTDAFKSEFRRTPSEIRREISTNKLKELSRNLDHTAAYNHTFTG